MRDTEMNGANKCGFIRDYYELALEDGGVYRVFRDLNSHNGSSTAPTTD